VRWLSHLVIVAYIVNSFVVLIDIVNFILVVGGRLALGTLKLHSYTQGDVGQGIMLGA
jgi:hypothetical protein